MNTIQIDSHTITLPSEWKEVTPEQLLKLCYLKGLIDSPYELLTQWLYAISGLNPAQKDRFIKPNMQVAYWYTLGKAEVLINEDDVSALARSLEWVFDVVENENTDSDEPTLVYRFAPKLWANPFPVLHGLHGPADGLTNCIYSEYADAEVHFFKYVETREEQQLDLLIATLWRPAQNGLKVDSMEYKGDLRSEYNTFYTPQIAKGVAKWTDMHKQAILLFYLSMRWYLAQNFDLVFETDESAPASTAKPDVFQFHLTLTHHLSKQTVTDREKVRAQLLYDVMDELQTMRKEAIALAEKYNVNAPTEI